ncbi:fimbria/pilus outer membrane usher protein, partial [Escherichia coli]|nr:fimbria/pilus outer membrane usher protein [Escherichia coli]
LDVTVTEANGAVSRFSVPFSAVPESMRPGTSRYNVEVGKTQDSGDDSMFGDLTWQHGMTNTLTFNSGSRIADGYQALML